MKPFSAQPGDALTRHLDALANDVRNVDLRDRVHAASRRITARRRIAVASAAAAAVMAVGSGVAFTGLPLTHRDPDRPAGIDSTVPAIAPTNSPSTTTTVTVDNAIPPTLYYQVARPTADGLRYDLWWWAGNESKLQFTPPGPACGMVLSPDARTVAWVTVTDKPDSAGELWVSSLDGNVQRRLLFDATCAGPVIPKWLDSETLLVVQSGNYLPQLIDVHGGKAADSAFAPGIADLVLSPEGQFAAYSADGKIVVCRPDGTVIRRIAHQDQTSTGGFALQGISDDGRRLVLGPKSRTPGHARTGSHLVDTFTGRNIGLPRGVETRNALPTEIHPMPGNHLLVRVNEGRRNKIYLLDATDTILDTRTEPASLHQAVLLPSTDL
jgi:hypothetical protein